MGQRPINALREVTSVVIDFEYTTPTGAAPEPIEIAVQALRVREGKLEHTARWEALMRPPQHAELTTFDINQTGITPDMLADRPYAGEVLAELDRRFTAGPYVLVAHHAPAEARLLFDYREHCPHLARIDLLDTVRLAREPLPRVAQARAGRPAAAPADPLAVPPPPRDGQRPGHYRPVHPHGDRQRLGRLAPAPWPGRLRRPGHPAKQVALFG